MRSTGAAWLGIVAGSALLALAGCVPNAPAPHPHVELGAPYQAGGVWFYPHDSATVTETGIARVDPPGHPGLTADGEAYDPAAMAAAHQTLRLPAIGWVTNLANGRQVEVRINDRGPASVHQFLSLTPRAAALLGIPRNGVAPVRLTLDEAATEAARAALPGGKLAIAAAPVAGVQSVALAPLAGSRVQANAPVGQAAPAGAAAAPSAPLRLAETVRQVPVRPYRFAVRLGSFSSYGPARMQSARVIWLHPSIRTVQEGRSQSYRVMLGPFTRLADADAALDAARHAGAGDARIVVDEGE